MVKRRWWRNSWALIGVLIGMWVFFLGWQGWRVDWDGYSVTIMQSGRVPFERVVPTVTPTPYPTTTPSPKRVILDVRGTENLVTARLVAVARNEEEYDLEVRLSAVDYAHEVVLDGEESRLGASVWRGQVSVDFIDTMERDQLNRVQRWGFVPAEDFRLLAWSSGDKVMGLKVGDMLVMVRLEEGGSVTLPTWEDYPSVSFRRSWRVAAVEEVPLSLGELEYEKLFFDGKGEGLYVGVVRDHHQAVLEKAWDQGDLWKYDFSTKKFELVSRPEGVPVSNIYPIPGSSWLMGWSISLGGNQPLMVWWGEGRQRELALEGEMDYPGKIVVSPGMNYACYEGGSSGGWWAGVVRLAGGNEIYRGPSYSYCRKWMDERTVVVVEKDYHSSYVDWFSLDVVSGKKTLLDSVK